MCIVTIAACQFLLWKVHGLVANFPDFCRNSQADPIVMDYVADYLWLHSKIRINPYQSLCAPTKHFPDALPVSVHPSVLCWPLQTSKGLGKGYHVGAMGGKNTVFFIWMLASFSHGNPQKFLHQNLHLWFVRMSELLKRVVLKVNAGTSTDPERRSEGRP